MKYFSLIDSENVHIARDKKIIPSEEFSILLEASDILKKAKEKEVEHFKKVKKESAALKEKAKKEGFEEGLKQFNEQIALLEKEIQKVRREMEGALVPIATASVKKIIGKELQTNPETVVDIISTALKSVSQHRKITIYVNPQDLDAVEKNRPSLKSLFEHLESLTIAPREDVSSGGCIIETEAGIINASMENQLNALEAAFRTFFQNHQLGG